MPMNIGSSMVNAKDVCAVPIVKSSVSSLCTSIRVSRLIP